MIPLDEHRTLLTMDLATRFLDGLSYEGFLDKYANSQHRERWTSTHEAIELSSEQKQLVSSFVREMNIMVLAGAWCGDCAAQCPIFDHFAHQSPKIQLRFFDRDVDKDLAEVFPTCGGHRVPTVLFLSEDFHICGRYGDRTLAKYRDMVQKQLGPACPTGIGSVDKPLLHQVIQEWLNEFERIQWMLRLSSRLRTLHGD